MSLSNFIDWSKNCKETKKSQIDMRANKYLLFSFSLKMKSLGCTSLSNLWDVFTKFLGHSSFSISLHAVTLINISYKWFFNTVLWQNVVYNDHELIHKTFYLTDKLCLKFCEDPPSTSHQTVACARAQCISWSSLHYCLQSGSSMNGRSWPNCFPIPPASENVITM